jgi:hypothetical protein
VRVVGHNPRVRSLAVIDSYVHPAWQYNRIFPELTSLTDKDAVASECTGHLHLAVLLTALPSKLFTKFSKIIFYFYA